MVFDVDKLKEAVEAYEELPGFIEFAQDNYNATVTLFAAARMVAAGQPLWWCEEHRASANRAGKVPTLKLCDYAAVLVLADESFAPCRMVEGWWMPTGKDET